jgi:Flp pilus assembly protein TadD
VALVFEAAALLSKESGMVLPVLIAAYVWIFGTNSGRETASIEAGGGYSGRFINALWASIPFWLVLLAYVPARIHALKGFTHVITPLPLSTVMLTVPSVVLFYLRLLVWPAGLSCYYDTTYVLSPTWYGLFAPFLALIVVAAALGHWFVRARRGNPASAHAMEFAFVWMALTILPVLNLRFLPAGEIAHDRYVYLPSVGFVMLAAVALGEARRLAKIVLWPVLRVAFAAVLVLALGFATARQNLFWSDDLTLNARAHAIAPNNVYATTSLAAAVAEQGMEGAALALYQQVLARQPDFWRANVNLGYLEYSHANYPQAVHYFARACESDPTDGDEFLYLGMSLLRTGEPEEAEKAVRTALLVRPAGQNYHLGLAMVLKGEGKLREAKTEVQTELASNPQNAQAKSVLEELDRQISAATP